MNELKILIESKISDLDAVLESVEYNSNMHVSISNDIGIYKNVIKMMNGIESPQSESDTCQECGCSEFLCGHNKRG